MVSAVGFFAIYADWVFYAGEMSFDIALFSTMFTCFWTPAVACDVTYFPTIFTVPYIWFPNKFLYPNIHLGVFQLQSVLNSCSQRFRVCEVYFDSSQRLFTLGQSFKCGIRVLLVKFMAELFICNVQRYSFGNAIGFGPLFVRFLIVDPPKGVLASHLSMSFSRISSDAICIRILCESFE